MPRDEQTLAEPPPHSGEILHSRRIKLYSATIVNAITLSVLFGVTAACPNECNGRGFCNPQRSQECICDAGFTGVDCSLRVCPAGAAWIDYAHAKNSAHRNYTECSGFGYCDRKTGLCDCREGFTGEACNRNLCPTGPTGIKKGSIPVCSGHGRCMSLREAGDQRDFMSLFSTATYSEWEADKLHGCVCDEGFQGFDCSERQCPHGPDPYVVSKTAYETQIVDCYCPVKGTARPTTLPTLVPTPSPSSLPSLYPTTLPTLLPTFMPTALPTKVPFPEPTANPTAVSEYRVTSVSDIASALVTISNLGSAATIIFRNDIALPSNKTLTISEIDDLTIDGKGFTLTGTKNVRILNIEDADNLVIKHLTFRDGKSDDPKYDIYTRRRSLQALSPSALPTLSPSALPTLSPTLSPSALPTLSPTLSPSALPTLSPTLSPSPEPTSYPTYYPDSGSDNGGAVRLTNIISANKAHFFKCNFIGNKGYSGGAVSLENAVVDFELCNFQENEASLPGDGGAIYLDSNSALKSDGSIFSGNKRKGDHWYVASDYTESCDDVCDAEGLECNVGSLTSLDTAAKFESIMASLGLGTYCSNFQDSGSSSSCSSFAPFVGVGSGTSCYFCGTSSDSSGIDCSSTAEDGVNIFKRLCNCKAKVDFSDITAAGAASSVDIQDCPVGYYGVAGRSLNISVGSGTVPSASSYECTACPIGTTTVVGKAAPDISFCTEAGNTFEPSIVPVRPPSLPPTLAPSDLPTLVPTPLPSAAPTKFPSPVPTEQVAGGCVGHVRLTFRDQSTRPIPVDASTELVKTYLQRLSSINYVDVEFRRNSEFCSPEGTVSFLTFTDIPGSIAGSLEPITASVLPFSDPEDGKTANPIVSVAAGGISSYLLPGTFSTSGTVGDYECNRRGTCDYSSGNCTCFEGFSSRKHIGDVFLPSGSRGDCGRWDGEELKSCPVATGVWKGSNKTTCSGANFTCTEDFICNCKGYSGYACEFKACPRAKAWFGEATETSSPHKNSTECGYGGLCNRETGRCNCNDPFGLFEGLACHKMACPDAGWVKKRFYQNRNDYGKEVPMVEKQSLCYGSGTCMTMKQLARRGRAPNGQRIGTDYDEPWDAGKIQGCHCMQSHTVTNDNTTGPPHLPSYVVGRNNFDGTDKQTFRGPYAYTYTDFYGYDCTRAVCPTGDDPITYGANEVQVINCTASNGFFKMEFRHKVTPRIPYYADAATLQAALNDLTSIGEVKVTYTFGNKACVPTRDFSSRTGEPSALPTPLPTLVPTSLPTTEIPTPIPTVDVPPRPTAVPTLEPTGLPSLTPTVVPTRVPTSTPTPVPTQGWQLRMEENPIYVEFLTEFGDLPMLKAYNFTGFLNGTVNTTEYIKGTKENRECGRRGFCDDKTGRCDCLDNYRSSNRKGSAGEYGDCGYRTSSTEYVNMAGEAFPYESL